MEENGNGYVRASIDSDYPDSIYIDNLNVCPKHRERGLGQTLLNECEAIAKQEKKTHSVLWVKKDSWVRRWYLKEGYEYLNVKNETEVYLMKELQ